MGFAYKERVPPTMQRHDHRRNKNSAVYIYWYVIYGDTHIDHVCPRHFHQEVWREFSQAIKLCSAQRTLRQSVASFGTVEPFCCTSHA